MEDINLNPSADSQQQEQSDEPLREAGKKALETERLRNKELSQKLKELQSQVEKFSAIDLEQYNEALEFYRTQKDKEKSAEAREAERLQKLVQAKEQLAKELQERDTYIQSLKAEQSTMRLKNAVAQVYFANGGKNTKSEITGRDYFEELMAVVGNRFQFDEETGKVHVVDPVTGVVCSNSEGTGDKTVDDFMNELANLDTYKGYFNRGKGPGAGLTTGVNGKGQRKTFQDFMKEVTGIG